MSDGQLRDENEDVNDVPISPPGPDVPLARIKREAPARVGRGEGAAARGGEERVVDTDENPDALPPGDHRQDAGAREASRNIDEENGGPTPAIGP